MGSTSNTATRTYPNTWTNSNAFSTLTDSWNLHMKIGFSSGYCNKNIPWDCVGAPEVYVSGYVLVVVPRAEPNLHLEVPTNFLHSPAPGTSTWWLGLDKGTATRIYPKHYLEVYQLKRYIDQLLKAQHNNVN